MQETAAVRVVLRIVVACGRKEGLSAVLNQHRAPAQRLPQVFRDNCLQETKPPNKLASAAMNATEAMMVLSGV
jgi:hypothetical protein